jgi:hypothetical protein
MMELLHPRWPVTIQKGRYKWWTRQVEKNKDRRMPDCKSDETTILPWDQWDVLRKPATAVIMARLPPHAQVAVSSVVC